MRCSGVKVRSGVMHVQIPSLRPAAAVQYCLKTGIGTQPQQNLNGLYPTPSSAPTSAMQCHALVLGALFLFLLLCVTTASEKQKQVEIQGDAAHLAGDCTERFLRRLTGRYTDAVPLVVRSVRRCF